MKHLHHTLAALALAAACIPATAQNDWQSRKDRENAATSASSITRNGGRWDEKAEAERKEETRRRLAQQPLTGFTHCDPSFCYGNNGQPYTRSGPDVLVSPQGKTCHRSGSTWVCP